MSGPNGGVYRHKVPGGEEWINALDGSKQYLPHGAQYVQDTPPPGWQGDSGGDSDRKDPRKKRDSKADR